MHLGKKGKKKQSICKFVHPQKDESSLNKIQFIHSGVFSLWSKEPHYTTLQLTLSQNTQRSYVNQDVTFIYAGC